MYKKREKKKPKKKQKLGRRQDTILGRLDKKSSPYRLRCEGLAASD
jgi:hypothetical protein